MIPRAQSASSSSPASAWLVRWSVGDWIAVFFLIVVGFKLDQMPPFEIDIGPQLAHDYTITYPHTPADRQQVPAPLLWKLVFFLPLVLLTPLVLFRLRSVPMIELLAQLFLGVLSSVSIALCIVCVVKNCIGRLRPDFIARCQPVDGKCTGDPLVIMEGRKSFPSGHSALSFAGLGYVSLAWLAAAMSDPMLRPIGTLPKLIVSGAPWTFALLIALSRYEDYWHHWQDIVVGSLIGHLCCYGAFLFRFPAPSLGLGLVPHAFAATKAGTMGGNGMAAVSEATGSASSTADAAKVV